MPAVVVSETLAESLPEESFILLELVPRKCTLEPYKKIQKIPTFKHKGKLIAYASPDSTYAVTKGLLDEAKKSILIGIYDFSAEYMKDILLSAIRRGVKVSLMLDLDGAKGELPIFKDLKKFGCNAVPAPSCASKNANYFSSSHEKVIVIDGEWTLVQSGNYSKNSIPFNEIDGGDPKAFVHGNRDMGVAVRSKSIASFFSKVLLGDIKLELDAAGQEGVAAELIEGPELVEEVPKSLPTKLFKSKPFTPKQSVDITPILSPDNYMNVIPDFLESATKSIFIEQQYIRSSQNHIAKLLSAIRRQLDRNPKLDVRIILGRPFGSKGAEKEMKNITNMKKEFGLKLGTNVRFIDDKRIVHCHNKLISVDHQAVLISSQNWSDSAVSLNREAGVLVELPAMARYYESIFESDWTTASNTLAKVKHETISEEAISGRNMMEVSIADYQEV